jgi:hypothetical protein
VLELRQQHWLRLMGASAEMATSIGESGQLSRLIRDNATSTEHAARRLVRADGSDQLVPFDSDARFA